jgi:hypothetical protein
MLAIDLQKWLTAPTRTASDPRVRLWFCLSLAAAGFYSWLVLHQAFNGEYIVQDDARQHVFWMQRFVNPALFPRDWIADYYQSVAPWGYANLYRAFAVLGISPMLLNKILGLPLGLIATAYCFGISWQLLPVPAAGFVASLLLNQNLWLEDDLVSGTARAFLYPIFLAFLYYLIRGELFPCLVAIALAGLFYPQFVLVIAGILLIRLCRWKRGLRFSSNPKDYQLSIAGLGVSFLVLLPYVLETSTFGPVVTAAAAKAMPEFSPEGRNSFFMRNAWYYWLTAQRSGALLWVMPLCMAAPVLLPMVLHVPSRFPLVRQVRNSSLLLQVFLVCLGLFCAAHALLFKLYLPGRYLQNSLQILTPLAAGIAVIILLDGLLQWANLKRIAPQRQLMACLAVVGLSLILILSPKLYYDFPNDSYIIGQRPTIYQFFAQQPEDVLIASLTREADNIPSFSQRSVLVSREYAIAYHNGYYQRLRQRVQDQLRAQYSPEMSMITDFIRNYGIDYWLVDRAYLQTTQAPGDERLRTNQWLQQFQPLITEIQAQLDRNQTPALVTLVDRCSVLEEKDLIVLQSSCILALEPD